MFRKKLRRYRPDRSIKVMVKKKNKNDTAIAWIMASLFLLLLVLGFLKNYAWLKKQNTKPFGAIERTTK